MNTSPVTVLFFGPQGAGKGTQVKMLIEYLKKKSEKNIIQIDMGQLLRDMVAGGTYSGKLTDDVISIGGRMLDFMPIYVATHNLVQNLTGVEHIIADGLARGREQTSCWDQAMTFYKRDNFCIINLELTEEDSIKRLLARGRNDDTASGIKKRLAWHKTDVEPQLTFLASRNRPIHNIDGGRSQDEVHGDVLKALGLS